MSLHLDAIDWRNRPTPEHLAAIWDAGAEERQRRRDGINRIIDAGMAAANAEQRARWAREEAA